MLVIFSGGSGVGKNTIIEKMIETGNFALLPTYTTRQKRPNEHEGNPYYYISETEFKQKVENGEFYEYNIVHGNYYGTSRKLFKEKEKLGKTLLKDIDVLGTQDLLNTLGKDTDVLTIFLRVDSKEILMERLINRNEQEIEKRLSRYEMEQQYEDQYDYIVTNNDLEETLSNCMDIVKYAKDGLFFKSSQSIRDMSEDKIIEFSKILKSNPKHFSPIDVAIKKHELYIIDGHHRYMASLLSGVKIAVRIINAPYIDLVEQVSWENSILHFIRERENGVN